MQELENYSASNFDYSLVDDSTANFLKQKLSNMNGIAQDTRYRMGKELYETQQNLANHYKGVFVKWYESLGLNKNDVYFWINEFRFSRNLENTQQIANFGNAPKTLKKDVMQNSAKPEAVQRVLSGDITTHKEYKELEKKLKQSEEANKTLDGILSENAETISALEQQVKNKPKPEVVEKTVTKEVKPDDYDELKRQASVADDLKRQREQSQSQIDKLQQELNDLKTKNKYQKVIDTEEADRQHRLSVLKVETAISIYSLIRDIQSFLKKENVLRDISKVNGFDDESKRDLQEANDGLQRFVDEVNQILSGRKIVEGKFTE